MFHFGKWKKEMATVVLDDGGGSILSCPASCYNNNSPKHASQFPTPMMIRQQKRKEEEKKSEIQQTEDFLASEMHRLTFQERSDALNDIHCVGEELKETPEMVQKSLAEFDEAVRSENNPIYEMAAAQNKSYVEDPSFRLKFLRANMHNVNRSVRQMMNFLRYKATYFGNDKVAREITLDDLDEEDMKVMLSGLFHMQDGRDRTGRVVVYMFNTLLGKFKAENLIRVAYYIWFNVMIPLPEVQMKGLVGVYLDVAKPGEKIPIPGFNFMLTVMNFTCSLPMRYSGMHLCVKGSDKGNLGLNNSILGIAMNGFPQYARVRARIHYGSMQELQYQLKTYGLPVDTCPVDTDGNIRMDILNAWFENHKAFEEVKFDFLSSFPDPSTAAATCNNSSFTLGGAAAQPDFLNPRILSDEEDLDSLFGEYKSSSDFHHDEHESQDAHVIPLDFDYDLEPLGNNGNENNNQNNNSDEETRQEEEPQRLEQREVVVTHPTRDDVLLGRGRDIQNHEGNVRFRKFLQPYSDEYDHAPRSKRRKIAVQMNEVLNAKGIRFLKQSGINEWVESDPESAEKKIAQLFRSLRKKK